MFVDLEVSNKREILYKVRKLPRMITDVILRQKDYSHQLSEQ
jgi:hypothetical protein